MFHSMQSGHTIQAELVGRCFHSMQLGFLRKPFRVVLSGDDLSQNTVLQAARPGQGTFHSLQSELVRGYYTLLYTARNCQRMFHIIQLGLVKLSPTLRPFSTCQGFHKDFLQFPLFLEKVCCVFFSSILGTMPGRHAFPFFLLFLEYDSRAFFVFSNHGVNCYGFQLFSIYRGVFIFCSLPRREQL